MIGLLSLLAAVLYCFPWLRPPEIGGVALPTQRLLAWIGLSLLLSRLLLKGSLTAGPAARGFLRLVALFVLFLLLLLVRELAYGENFFPLYFFMDLSKYSAAFAMAYLCYYALSTGLIAPHRFLNGVMLSGAVASVVVFLLLGLYLFGFRSDNQILAPSFGGALGVWPTGGWIPRLAGPTAEPQQLSVALLTPLLLMLSREHIQRYWPLAILTGLALLLSQSKFAVISILLVMLYLFLAYPRWRTLIVMGIVITAPALGLALIQLPTFSETLQAGLSAGAIVERLGNIVLLLDIIREHPLFGIGPGHYGVYWGHAFYGDWKYNPGYTPNMDFLKVFAETGVAGFLLILFLLGFLLRLFARAYRTMPTTERPRFLALFLGAIGIILNMAIGYELLHAFFWINIGVLLYLVDQNLGRTKMTPMLESGLELAPSPLGG